MNYTDFRESIGSGDLVFVHNKNYLKPFLGHFKTAGIAVWLRDAAFESRLMLVECDSKKPSLVNLSGYHNCNLTVVKSEVPFFTYSQELLSTSLNPPHLTYYLNLGGLYLPSTLSFDDLYFRLTREMNWPVKATNF